VLRLRRHRAPAQKLVLDLGDGKSPERRRADARRAQFEHQKRLLEIGGAGHPMTKLQAGGPGKSAS
jgi:hypothetical protein